MNVIRIIIAGLILVGLGFYMGVMWFEWLIHHTVEKSKREGRLVETDVANGKMFLLRK